MVASPGVACELSRAERSSGRADVFAGCAFPLRTITAILVGMRTRSTIIACGLAIFLAACGSISLKPEQAVPATSSRQAGLSSVGHEVSLYALGLVDTGYRFGGKNPDAGLDCSGMVSYVFGQAAGVNLTGSAADIARSGRPVKRGELRPGDLVFFNTRNAPFTHVGIYIGDNRFVHAPSTNGRVRIDQMNARYYAQRFDAARTYFD